MLSFLKFLTRIIRLNGLRLNDYRRVTSLDIPAFVSDNTRDVATRHAGCCGRYCNNQKEWIFHKSITL